MTLAEHPDDQVTVLDKLTYAGNERNLDPVRDDPRFRFVKGDIADGELVRGLAGACDVVVNFAAEFHVDRSLEEPGQFILTDVFGTYVLLEAACSAGHARFLQVSTDEVYGTWARVVAERAIRSGPAARTARARREASCSSRPIAPPMGFRRSSPGGSNTYGWYQYPEKIIPLFVTNALEDKPLPIYGDGTAVRDYIFVEDHCRGIELPCARAVRARITTSGRAARSTASRWPTRSFACSTSRGR